MRVKILSAGIVLFGFGAAHGHAGDRVFPFYEITDVTAIDMTDGSIEDWEELFGEPTLTSLDFTVHLLPRVRREHGLQRPTSTSASGSASDRCGAICIDEYIGEGKERGGEVRA